MKPEWRARQLLGITRAKAKMWEYRVPEGYHIKIEHNPERLFDVSLAALGDLSAAIAGGRSYSAKKMSELTASLRFASQFLEAHRGGRFNPSLDDYTALTASACYYLCDMPGSSAVIARELSLRDIDLSCNDLDRLLLRLLVPNPNLKRVTPSGTYSGHIEAIDSSYASFMAEGKGSDALLRLAEDLRSQAYRSGTPRELLFADVIAAVLKRRADNSAWRLLPIYSSLRVKEWTPYLKKADAIRELWPAQRLLGEKGLLDGSSAVIQMPTSAGKTRAAELIIRSSFLAGRSTLAVLVAPYRALCHEVSRDLRAAFADEGYVVTELTDVPQEEGRLFQEGSPGTVLVMTPEKLAYVLRHHPELTQSMGLLVYDEAHLFDDPTRGVNYELLLAYIKEHLVGERQTVLISAVMSNADEVAGWLLGSPEATVSGASLVPTARTVAYASWTRRLCRLEFPQLPDIEDFRFFVPRVLGTQVLHRRRTPFPDKKKAPQVALCLGLKLAENGGVAVFCGTKATVNGICSSAVDAFDRGLDLPVPVDASDRVEVEKIAALVEQEVGADAGVARAARLGILAHHGSIPQGIRRAIEHAMHTGKARLVICTSTLAQGVNLPIRYLIVTSVFQGRTPIKTRDFHNLMGRAGRAGKYSEGSVIFADPSVFDERSSAEKGHRWRTAVRLLDPNNSEDCGSAIQLLLKPVYRDDGKEGCLETKPLDWLELYLEDADTFVTRGVSTAATLPGYSADEVRKQLLQKLNVITALESFLLVQLEEMRQGGLGPDSLIEQTLAFQLADDGEREVLVRAIQMLTENIESTVADADRQAVYGRSLLGLADCRRLDSWLDENMDRLLVASSRQDLLEVLWPLFEAQVRHPVLNRCHPRDALRNVIVDWTGGSSYHELHEQHLSECLIGDGIRPRKVTAEQVVDLCEQAFSFNGSVLIGAVVELLRLRFGDQEGRELLSMLLLLQRQLKYGLPSQTAICVYELGLSDRVVAQEISAHLADPDLSRSAVRRLLRRRRDELTGVVDRFPSYFVDKFRELTLVGAVRGASESGLLEE